MGILKSEETRSVNYCIKIIETNGLKVFFEEEDEIWCDANFVDRKTSGWNKKEWRADKLEREWLMKLEPISDLIRFEYDRCWIQSKLFYIWRVIVNTKSLKE